MTTTTETTIAAILADLRDSAASLEADYRLKAEAADPGSVMREAATGLAETYAARCQAFTQAVDIVSRAG
jgi:hypothetical protein